MVIVAVMSIQFISRSALELNVVRDRTSLYRENNMGLIENTYTLILMNKSQAALTVNISVNGLSYTGLFGSEELRLAPSELLKHPITLTIDPAAIEETVTPIEFIVQTSNFKQKPTVVKQQSTFIYR